MPAEIDFSRDRGPVAGRMAVTAGPFVIENLMTLEYDEIYEI